MAGYEKLAAEIQSVAERTATNRPVATKALDKLAIGRDFRALNITVNQPLAEGDILLKHQPPDGNEKRLFQATVDNSLRIQDATTGNTNAWFYPNGKTYVDLVDNAINTDHYTDESITNIKIAPLTLTGTKVANLTLTAAKFADRTITAGKIGLQEVGNGELADDSTGDGKIYSGGVVYSHLASDTKNKSQGTPSLRQIQSLLGGSSLEVAAGNHSHLSVNFNSSYTLEQKEASASLVTQVRDMVVQPQLEPLRLLVLDVAHQLMDEPDHDVTEKIRRLKEDRAYAHEFRMKYDDEYYAAWSIDHVPAYAVVAENDPRIQEMAAHARQVYARIEDDPTIVEDYLRRKGPFS